MVGDETAGNREQLNILTDLSERFDIKFQSEQSCDCFSE